MHGIKIPQQDFALKCRGGVFAGHYGIYKLASFPGSALLLITCSMENRGEPGIFSLHNQDMAKFAEQAAFCVFSTDYMLNAQCVIKTVDHLPPARYVW